MASPPLDLYTVTFNCGRVLLDVDTFASTLFSARKTSQTTPDVLFFSLQEVAPIAYSFLGGALLAPYFARFLQAVDKAAGPENAYRHLITHNVGMTAIMVFVKSELAEAVQWVQTGEVGVGWSEMGNKGAAAVRLGFRSDQMSETVPITLVAAHLAPMEEAFKRRNEDWENIARRLVFKPPGKHTASLSRAIPPAAEEDEVPLLGESPDALPSQSTRKGMFISGSPVFFAGDLNYRTGDAPPDPEKNQLHSFPQPRRSPADSLHYSNLLPFDQLTRERRAGNTLHGLSEATISFPPTYKFSPKQQESMTRAQYFAADEETDEEVTWHWSSHRLPSWCDRILFSSSLQNSQALSLGSYTALHIQPTSDHRPVALDCLIDLQAAGKALRGQKPVFELDQDWEARGHAARRREVMVGVAAYLGLTWEGNGLLAASLIGVLGGWFVMSSLIVS